MTFREGLQKIVAAPTEVALDEVRGPCSCVEAVAGAAVKIAEKRKATSQTLMLQRSTDVAQRVYDSVPGNVGHLLMERWHHISRTETQ